MKNVVEIAVRGPLDFIVDGKHHKIEFPLSAVMEAEEKLGRSLKTPVDWFGAKAKDIPVLLKAGLTKNHPDVTDADVKAICDQLGPESYTEVAEALGALAFPRWTEEFKKRLEKIANGGKDPNVTGADAS